MLWPTDIIVWETGALIEGDTARSPGSVTPECEIRTTEFGAQNSATVGTVLNDVGASNHRGKLAVFDERRDALHRSAEQYRYRASQT
ncbi:MAG: hypothetical protein ACI9TI_000998, partial [Natronomonas sp.]